MVRTLWNVPQTEKEFCDMAPSERRPKEMRMSREVKELNAKNGMMQRCGVGSGCPPAVPVQWNMDLVNR